jgi:hypothetical protein
MQRPATSSLRTRDRSRVVLVQIHRRLKGELSMRSYVTLFSSSSRIVAFVVMCGLGMAATVAAQDLKNITARANGSLVYQAPCADSTPENPLICQAAVVTGQVSQIGGITGVLNDRIDAVGTYTGVAVFTTPNGDTLTTEYTGQATAPGPDGSVTFSEWHRLASGTGRFANSVGTLTVNGRAEATGAITIEGTGQFAR